MRTKVTLVLLFLNVALFYFIFQFVIWLDYLLCELQLLIRVL